MREIVSEFKNQLGKGNSVYGPFMKTSDPAIVETSGYAGFDFAILDMEHGPVSIETMQNNIRAAHLSGMLPIIRVRDHSPESISQALDIGAGGIQVPQIRTASDVKKVIEAAKFKPMGDRGLCRFVRAAKYSSMDRNDYFEEANNRVVVIQVEGEEAIDNIDSILEVDGYDVLFIGPYDLSQSLGVPGDISNPKVIEKMSYVVNKAREKNVVLGTFIDTIENYNLWKNSGLQYFSYSVDVGIFYDACCNLLKDLRK